MKYLCVWIRACTFVSLDFLLLICIPFNVIYILPSNENYMSIFCESSESLQIAEFMQPLHAKYIGEISVTHSQLIISSYN
jgi:hypothetical protein